MPVDMTEQSLDAVGSLAGGQGIWRSDDLGGLEGRTIVGVGQVSEVGQALAITVIQPILLAVGQASEVDSALSFTAIDPFLLLVGQAAEVSVAQSFTPVLGGDLLPGDLSLDGVATPEQMGLIVENAGATATASVRVRTNAGPGAWSLPIPMHHVQLSDIETPPGGADARDVLARTIIDQDWNTAYDVELTLVDGVTTDVRSPVTFTTRQEPPVAPAVTDNVNDGQSTAAIQAVIDGLSPGDHLRFAVGNYDFTGGGLDFNGVIGTEANPIWISGADRDTVIHERQQNSELHVYGNTEWVIFEDFTISGYSADVSAATGSPNSVGFLQSPGSTSPRNVVWRRISGFGFHRGIRGEEDHEGCLFYECKMFGTNRWARRNIDFLGGAGPSNFNNLVFDDYGVHLIGNGNCVFDSTLVGFGDTISFANATSGGFNWQGINQHAWRLLIKNGCDDGVEADDATRNLSMYDCLLVNCNNLDSCDPLYGGPLLIARNVVLNMHRSRIHKWQVDNSGMHVWCNTILATEARDRTGGPSGELANWYQPAGGNQENFAHQGNIYVRINVAPLELLRLENFGYNTMDWSFNSYYPDNGSQLPSQNNSPFTNVADLVATGDQATELYDDTVNTWEGENVIAPADFGNIVLEDVLGRDSTVEIEGTFVAADFEITSGNAQKSMPVIPNINEGATEQGGLVDRGAVPEGLTRPTYGDQSGASEIPLCHRGLADYEVREYAGAFAPQLGNTTMEDVVPNEWLTSDPGTSSGFIGVIRAWSGGPGSHRGKQLFVHGGGHNDSANNHVFIWDADGGARPFGWDDGSDGSVIADVVAEAQAYNDGRPNSVHTYLGLLHAYNRGEMYRFGGSRFQSGAFTNAIWRYRYNDAFSPDATGRWEQMTSASVGVSTGEPCAFYQEDEQKFVLAHVDGSGWQVFDCVNETLSAVRSPAGTIGSFDLWGGYDHTRRRVIMSNSSNHRLWDINYTTDDIDSSSAITFSGFTEIVTEPTIGCIYDEVRDVFWLYGGRSATRHTFLYWFDAADLDSPTNVNINRVALTGVGSLAPNGLDGSYRGSYNRHLYVPEWRMIFHAYDTASAVVGVKIPVTP